MVKSAKAKVPNKVSAKKAKELKTKFDCKRNGYYQPWNVDWPWEDLQERINKMNAARKPPPVVYTGDQKRHIEMTRGLEYYVFLRAQAKRAAKKAKGKKK